MVVKTGETLINNPVPATVPPQEFEYQYHFAPVPKLPPVKLKDVRMPEQTGEIEFMEFAEIDKVLIETEIETLGDTHVLL